MGGQAGTAGAGHASEPHNADFAPIATSSPHHLDQAGTAGAGHALQAEELLTEFGRAQGMEDCLQGHAHQVHAAGPFAEPPAAALGCHDMTPCPGTPSNDTLVDGSDEADEAEEEEITLRLRLGIVVIKKEPVEDAPERRLAGNEVVAQEAPAALMAAHASPAKEATSGGSGSSGDLRRYFGQQAKQSEEDAAEDDINVALKRSLEEQQSASQEMNEQFETAQIASYDLNVAERKERATREREAVEQGDLRSLDSLDEALMAGLYCGEGMMEWLGQTENRLLLYRYLEVKTKAVNWYAEPAKAYFELQQQHMDQMLGQVDVAVTLTEYFRNETDKVESALFEMPKKGSFLPRLFDEYIERSSGAAGDGLENSQGCVELD